MYTFVICLRYRPEEWAVLLVMAESHFQATRKGEEECAKGWAGQDYKFHSATHLNRDKVQNGEMVLMAVV